MSSITTTIPTSPIERWCLGAFMFYFECAKEKKGEKKTDYQTFCCDGDILDTKKDYWAAVTSGDNDTALNIADMVCCGLSGPQAGGILPLPTAYTECSAGSPTPLASIAATNTDNAVPFLVTYTSASYGGGTVVGDYIPTKSPTCFWAYKVGAETEVVTLPAPDITTLPSDSDEIASATLLTSAPTLTRSAQSSKITGSSSISTDDDASSDTAVEGSSGSTGAATSTSTPSSAALTRTGGKKRYMCLCFGLLATSFFWS